MTAQSSCRPDRLVHFDAVVQAMADGLQRRVGRLADAVAAYQAGCDAPFVIDCSGTVGQIEQWRGDLRVLGSWTKAVGVAFVRADAGTLPDAAVASTLGAFDDPYLGGPAGTLVGGVRLAEAEEQAADDRGLLAAAGLVPDRTTVLGAGLTGLSTGLDLDPGTAAAGRGLGKVANAFTAVVAGHHQWEQDEGLGLPDRILRTATVGGFAVGGSLGGQAVGEAAALECGPCAVVAGAAGNVIGGTAGVAVAGHLPYMHPGPHDPDNPEAERNDLEAAIARDPGDLGPDAAMAVDVPAAHYAEAALGERPEVAAQLPFVLPSTADESSDRPPTATTTTRPRPPRSEPPTAPPAVPVGAVARPTG